jgi:hypothetical protein
MHMGIIIQMFHTYHKPPLSLSGLAWQQCILKTRLPLTSRSTGIWWIRWWAQTSLLHRVCTRCSLMWKRTQLCSCDKSTVHCTASRFRWGMACTMSPLLTRQRSQAGTSGMLLTRWLLRSYQHRMSSIVLLLSGTEAAPHRIVS